MTPRQQLKDLGLDYKKLAEFFDMTPASFTASSARERYERAILKSIEYFDNIKSQSK